MGSYYRNFSGDSLEQVEAVDFDDVAKCKQTLIKPFFFHFLLSKVKFPFGKW